MEKDFTNKDIIHVKDKNNNVEYLKFRVLDKYRDKLNNCITLRHGGVSSGVYESLNFRTVGNDKYENVDKNLEIISSKLSIDKKCIYKGKQDHTDNILVLDDKNKEKYTFSNLSKECYDGYIVTKSNINTLVTTADCNPIIIYDPILNIVANVHSGWRGTIKNVSIKAAIIMHEKFNSKYEDLIVCIGPSIRKCCFTSKEEEFKNKFTSVFQDEEKYITKDKDGTFHIDLIYILKSEFLRLGVKEENIAICDIGTCCNSDSFYSYRKSKINKEEDYGTFATIVGMK